MKARARALLGLAAFIAVTGLGAGAASASEGRRLSGTALRNGQWLSKRALALAPVSSTAALTARLELRPSVMGGALGITTMKGIAHLPGREHLGLELGALRATGPDGGPAAVYVGPQLAYGAGLTQVTLGWLFAVEDQDNNHPQIGIGLRY